MSVHYTEDFKKEVIKAYMAGDKSIPQIAVEFNVAKAPLANGLTNTRKNASIPPAQPQNLMKQRKSED